MGILVGTDDGSTAVGTAAPEGPPGPVTALALDGKDLWASNGVEVWRSDDSLATVEGLRANCLLPVDGGLLIGTSDARLVRLADGRLGPVPGFDEAEGRDRWYTPWGGPPDTRSMSRGSDGTIYANVHVGGILRSADGELWEPTGIDIDADVHQVLAHPQAHGVVLAATAFGLAMSEDGGNTWTTYDDGLHAHYSRAVAVAGDTILVTASTGPFGGPAAVYRFRGDGPFERCTEGLPEWFDGNIDTHCLDASGSDVALGTADGRVFASEDAGETWELAAEGLAPVRCLLLA